MGAVMWRDRGCHTYGGPWLEERFSSQETHDARRRAKELGMVPTD